MSKWAYLIESDERLRKLERAWKESNAPDDKENYIRALSTHAGSFLWDDYTLPLFRNIIRMLKKRRQSTAVRVRAHDGFDETWMGYYTPDKDKPPAKITVRAFRDNELRQSTTSIAQETYNKHHLFGRMSVHMEFGRHGRGRYYSSPRKWQCDGSVELWTWGPDSDWASFAKGVPDKKHHKDVKRWKAKELLDDLYGMSWAACTHRNLLHKFGQDLKGKLTLPDYLAQKYKKMGED